MLETRVLIIKAWNNTREGYLARWWRSDVKPLLNSTAIFMNEKPAVQLRVV